jgi:hypothetical protein
VATLRRVLRKSFLLVVVFDILFWIVVGLDWFRGIRKMPTLRDVEVDPACGASVTLRDRTRTRDEEWGVEESVRTILEQDYPGPLEVVVVDDRSTRPTRSWNRSSPNTRASCRYCASRSYPTVG